MPRDSAYEPVIGLEVHAHLMTDSKIFCSCSASYGGDPNAQTCPVCLGLPGALPVLNRRAVEYAMRMIIAVGGRVSTESILARKNYFYPDLPKGYQISQYELPIGTGGAIAFDDDGQHCAIGLTRIHLEEDAGKSLHPEHSGETMTRLDLNRCGVPLIEIVSQPDIRSPKQASLYLHKIRQLVQYLGIGTGNMEEGALRCDANISIRPAGHTQLGTRTEVKNMNSFRSVERALTFEIERQIRTVRSGEEIVQETLLWDEVEQTARPMRSKEESSDYRYFPDPDLLPLRVSTEWLKSVQDSMPELPDACAERFVRDYGIPEYDAGVLTDQKELAHYFEETARGSKDAKLASNWIMTEVLRVLKDRNLTIDTFPIRPPKLSELLAMVATDRISGKIAKDVFEKMVESGRSAQEIVDSEGLSQISDADELSAMVEAVIESHPEQVADYRSGNKRVMAFFVGQIMKQTKGQANPQMVNELLRSRLGSGE